MRNLHKKGKLEHSENTASATAHQSNDNVMSCAREVTKSASKCGKRQECK